MATYQTFQAVGEREDLMDVIYDISPTDTPFMSTVPKTKATAVHHEWQLDSLAAAAANAAVEGADASSATLSATTRRGNYCQISQKAIVVAATLDAVSTAGRRSETAYQLAKGAKEIKRDMELTLLGNVGSSAGNATTARKLGGIQCWINSNKDVAGTAGTGDGTTARVSGTDRAFTEAQLKSVLKQVFTNGGNASVIYAPPTQKQNLSAFTGIAAQRYMASSDSPTTIVGAADVYMSDFGTLSVVPNRFMTADANDDGEVVLIIDPEMASVSYLRPFQTTELAKTGDAEKHQIIVEYTLTVNNEKAHGIVADLTE